MSHQAGPIEELIEYKKAVLHDDRRDSRIRGSIEATLAFFSQRRSTFINKFDSRTAIRDPSARRSSMTYPQISRPYQQFDNDKSNVDLGREVLYEKDVEVGSIHKGAHGHDAHAEVLGPLSFKERLKHFTFAWYAMTMSTGGVAFVLSVVPNRFTGLTGLGTGLFVFNLFLFTAVTATIIARFIIHPGTFTNSFTNPHEGFFSATAWLTIATMISNTTAYGIPNSGPWLIDALRFAFWIYTVCATLHAIIYYHILFTVKKLVITNVLPGWVLPIFPAMLVGTLASAIGKTQPPEHAMTILVAGLSYQGLGFFLALAMYGLYFGRLLTSGLPADMSRPAMFIAVGPPAFTALAFIGMAQDVQATKLFEGYTDLNGIANQDIIPDILSLLALLMAIFLWTLAFWFFAIATVASLEAVQRNDFHLNWYAYVFPNVGFTISTIKIGERLSSPGIQMVGTGMAAVLFFLWILIVICHMRAIANHKIMWPGKDEDAH
ncbi:related to C4-dicarboxylate transport protein [Phialocephala subalpina]|uniref:Related to C4-dicarboxylate transport protein n=1 Tax=Phialocephala subalpina TaxID=576137 RepID=A0A1L7X6L0_9HELO|nr:related to C4-dicarboxylate transport protein [Phialocephala subalpina]